MDRYFMRDILIFLTYFAAVQWGMYIERSYGCTPAQDALDFTPRCYSLPIEEVIQSPKEAGTVTDGGNWGEADVGEGVGEPEDDVRERWRHWTQRKQRQALLEAYAANAREASASAGDL